MIEFDNVSKSFWTGKTRKVILDRASFRVELGNSLGILAKNGTGKTTIINMMAGLEKPDEGRITRSSRISFPLGFMGGVISKHTATENARYIARLYGLDPDYVESFCRWLANIDEYFDQPVGKYSSGMRSRLTFGAAMGISFDTYLVDEVTAVGDASFRRKSRAVFTERMKSSSAIMVSHDTRTVREFCDAGLVLERGQLHYFDDLEDAIKLHQDLMGGA